MSALEGVVISVSGNYDRHKMGSVVRKEGGRVDNLVHKNVSFVVCDEQAIRMNTQRIRKAEKFGIPLVSENLILESIKAGKLLDYQKYLLRPPAPKAGGKGKEETVQLSEKSVADHKKNSHTTEKRPEHTPESEQQQRPKSSSQQIGTAVPSKSGNETKSGDKSKQASVEKVEVEKTNEGREGKGKRGGSSAASAVADVSDVTKKTKRKREDSNDKRATQELGDETVGERLHQVVGAQGATGMLMSPDEWRRFVRTKLRIARLISPSRRWMTRWV